ncbi:MAG: hypothetical protein WCJ49_06290, partial [Deltaproteobacteria bacterium]
QFEMEMLHRRTDAALLIAGRDDDGQKAKWQVARHQEDISCSGHGGKGVGEIGNLRCVRYRGV